MKMLRHKIHGAVYAFHEFLAKAEDIEIVEVPDAEILAPPAPPAPPEAPRAPEAPKPLEKMKHAELLELAMRLAGPDGPVQPTMKRDELIAYIKAEDL